MGETLLTIAIPTFNRAPYLEKCLESVTSQILPGDARVEVLVSDNCSTDRTPGVVERFSRTLPALRSLRNQSNLGPAANFARCMGSAKGRYCLILGDDDLLLPGAVETLLFLLGCGDYGVVSFRGMTSRRMKGRRPCVPRSLRIWEGPGRHFFNIHGYEPTFISVNVVNKRYLDDAMDPYSFLEPNLNQFSWVIPAVFRSSRCLFIDAPLIGSSEDNRGSFAIFEVFVTRQAKVFNAFAKLGYPAEVFHRHMRMRLYYFFPHYIFRGRTKRLGQGTSFLEEDILSQMRGYFRGHWYFTLVLIPLVRIPHPFFIPVFLLCSVVQRIWAGFRRLSFLFNSRKILIPPQEGTEKRKG